MRYDKQIIYPHPVLRRDGFDYKTSEFFAGISCVPAADPDGPIVITSDYRLNCPSIEALVADGSASVTMQVKCRSTSFSEFVNFARGKACMDVMPSEVYGSIEISVVIRANREISGFISDDFAEDFGDTSFNLKKNDLLAFANPVQLYVEREAFGSAESVIDIVQSDAVDELGWDVDTEHERLRILVGRNLMQNVAVHRAYPMGRLFLTASLYSSAIQKAIDTLKKGEDGLLWQRVIRQRCALNEIDLENCDSSTVTQLLLKFPLSQALETLKESRDAD
jgi:hypothetical protein